jgi:type III secretion protein C
VSSETIADLKQALTDIGLLDSRFGWGELPEDGVVLVSGPRRYIEQIKQFSSQRRSPDEKQSVLSFPLKFANAADRQVDYRGEKLAVPGSPVFCAACWNPVPPRPCRGSVSVLPHHRRCSRRTCHA